MKATILLPTTADRGPVLQHAVTSVRRQTMKEWELFIVGDGVSEETRACAEALVASDSRVRFFDFPKDESRGELNRHALLSNEAKGEVVGYLCDRDLYLENHLELMFRELQSCDMAHSMLTVLRDDGEIRHLNSPDTSLAPAERARAARQQEMIKIPLSFVMHRLDAYKKLPHGWRVTPAGLFTDSYMWQQFYACDWLRTSTVWFPTVVYLKRGNFPGLSTSERAAESRKYTELYGVPGGSADYQAAVNKSILDQRARYDQRILKYKRRSQPIWKRFFKS